MQPASNYGTHRRSRLVNDLDEVIAFANHLLQCLKCKNYEFC